MAGARAWVLAGIVTIGFLAVGPGPLSATACDIWTHGCLPVCAEEVTSDATYSCTNPDGTRLDYSYGKLQVQAGVLVGGGAQGGLEGDGVSLRPGASGRVFVRVAWSPAVALSDRTATDLTFTAKGFDGVAMGSTTVQTVHVEPDSPLQEIYFPFQVAGAAVAAGRVQLTTPASPAGPLHEGTLRVPVDSDSATLWGLPGWLVVTVAITVGFAAGYFLAPRRNAQAAPLA